MQEMEICLYLVCMNFLMQGQLSQYSEEAMGWMTGFQLLVGAGRDFSLFATAFRLALGPI
jgi:hypothetical protein